MASTRQLGILGETLAADYLTKKGYRILQRNFRCGFGEIDIIAEHAGCLTFIEVKTRRSQRYGRPEEAVNQRKLKKLYKLIEYYMLKHSAARVKLEVAAVEIKEETPVSIKIITVD